MLNVAAQHPSPARHLFICIARRPMSRSNAVDGCSARSSRRQRPTGKNRNVFAKCCIGSSVEAEGLLHVYSAESARTNVVWNAIHASLCQAIIVGLLHLALDHELPLLDVVTSLLSMQPELHSSKDKPTVCIQAGDVEKKLGMLSAAQMYREESAC